MANMNFGVNLLPKANNTYSLGNSDYKWLVNGMALASACQKDVDNTITANTTSTNLPTSQAVASFVSGLLDNPVITGSLNMGRLSGSTVGTGSVALGDHVTASGAYSIAGGSYTVANHKAQVVFGEYNSSDASTASASSRGNYILIVGNGTAENARSDALTLDWNGNLRIKGSIYVGANADGSGGTQLSNSLVSDVQLNGTSVLNNGVANIPCADENTLGVVRGNSNYGVTIGGNGLLCINGADLNTVKAGTNTQLPLIPYFQHASAFYGLAKASGDTTQSASSNAVGTYTDNAKASIRTMLGAGTYSLPSGGIPSTDLDSTVQTSLGLADTAYQLPSGGIPATDIASGVIPNITGKADKVTGATNGNFASLDADGNLLDSGAKASDFLTSHQDISGKADKTDTVLETTLSRGRTANSTVGSASFAFGRNCTASAFCSFAVGDANTSSGKCAFVCGSNNVNTKESSFVTGIYNTCNGNQSAVFGLHNFSCSTGSFVFGKYCEKDIDAPYWASGTAYAVNDKVVYEFVLYKCNQANSDATFDSSKWAVLTANCYYVEVVGNGGSEVSRKNIRTLDTSGNERIAGKLYIKCDKYGANGQEVLTRSTGRKSSTTDGTASLALGQSNTASGAYAVALGFTNTSSGYCSFAMGNFVTASGDYAIALCSNTTASGIYSTAIGYYAVANHKSQFVFGEYNVADPSTANATSRGTYVEIVGNGTGSNAKSNARTLDWNGNEKLAGNLTLNAFGNNPISLATGVVLKGCTWGDLKGS